MVVQQEKEQDMATKIYILPTSVKVVELLDRNSS